MCSINYVARKANTMCLILSSFILCLSIFLASPISSIRFAVFYILLSCFQVMVMHIFLLIFLIDLLILLISMCLKKSFQTIGEKLIKWVHHRNSKIYIFPSSKEQTVMHAYYVINKNHSMKDLRSCLNNPNNNLRDRWLGTYKAITPVTVHVGKVYCVSWAHHQSTLYCSLGHQ